MTYSEFCTKYKHLPARDFAELWEDFCIQGAANEMRNEIDKQVIADIAKMAQDNTNDPEFMDGQFREDGH